MVSGTTTGKGGTTLHSLLELGLGADATGVGTAKTARVRFDAKVSITTRTESDEPFILLRARHVLPVHAKPIIGVLVEERDEVKGVLAHLEEWRPERVIIRDVFHSQPLRRECGDHTLREYPAQPYWPAGRAIAHRGEWRECSCGRLRDQVPQAECIFLGKWLSVCTA